MSKMSRERRKTMRWFRRRLKERFRAAFDAGVPSVDDVKKQLDAILAEHYFETVEITGTFTLMNTKFIAKLPEPTTVTHYTDVITLPSVIEGESGKKISIVNTDRDEIFPGSLPSISRAGDRAYILKETPSRPLQVQGVGLPSTTVAVGVTATFEAKIDPDKLIVSATVGNDGVETMEVRRVVEWKETGRTPIPA